MWWVGGCVCVYYMCRDSTVCMCRHTTMYVYLCPLSTIMGICVLILPLYMCIYMCPHTATGGRIPLYVTDTPVDVSSYYYVCLHTTCVSSHYYICVLMLLYLSSHYLYYYHTTICVLILLYMCHHTTICVLVRLYRRLICVVMRYIRVLLAVYMCLHAVYMCPNAVCVCYCVYTGGQHTSDPAPLALALFR